MLHACVCASHNTQEGINLAKVPMTAWFHRQLRTGRVAASSGSNSSSSISGGSSRQPGSSNDGSNDGSHSSRVGSRKLRVSPDRGVVLAAGRGGGGGGDEAVPVLAGSFRQWVCGEEEAGRIVFTVKGRGDVCSSSSIGVAI